MCAGEIKLPCALQNKKEKTMDKKFYEMPEIEVIDLMLEGQILSGSDPFEDGGNGELPGEGGTDDSGLDD